MRNARLLVVLAGLRQTIFPIPVITLLWRRQMAMTLADVMLLQALFALVVSVCEVPSGYVADRVGHRRALLVGAALWVVGWGTYVFADGFASAALAETALGAGMAFMSGADSALLWTSLAGSGRTGEYQRWEGRVQAAAQTCEALSAACGGWLYAQLPRLPLWLQLPPATLALGVTLALAPTPPVARAGAGHAAQLVRVARHAMRDHPRLRTAIALSVVLGLSSFVLVWLVQPYMEARGVPEPWFGPVWAVANLWVGVVALVSHRVSDTFGAGRTLLVCCLLIGAGYGLMAATAAPWGVAFYLLIMTLRGTQIPLLRSRLQADAPEADRATVMSLNAMCFRLAFVVGGPLIALLLAHAQLDSVLITLGATFTTLALVALAAFRRAHTR